VRVLAIEMEELTRFELQIVVEQIRSLNRSIAELEEVIEREDQKLKGRGNLTSIKGIGPLGASILLSVIGDVGDFPDEGRLASYLVVPRVRNSNETERSGRITKRGSKLGRPGVVRSDRQTLQPISFLRWLLPFLLNVALGPVKAQGGDIMQVTAIRRKVCMSEAFSKRPNPFTLERAIVAPLSTSNGSQAGPA